jgi:hypothetical protein
MKKICKTLFISLLLLGCIAFAQISLAQPPPPADLGTNENKAPGNGGGAPIDGGLFISLAMAAGFGAWKLVKWKTMRLPAH